MAVAARDDARNHARPGGLSMTAELQLCRHAGVVLAGGQGSWKGRVIRMSHMGWVDAFDTLAGISAIGAELSRLEIGGLTPDKGVALARELLAATASAKPE